MYEQYLTARNLFRFLSVGIRKPGVSIPFLSPHLHVTQSGFWWCFLSSGIPESDLLCYFEPRKEPPRALSNLMNRTVPHAMPLKLYRAMEEYLTPETLLHITVWTASALDRDLNPRIMHEALTALEDGIFREGVDVEFASLKDFFTSLRPVSPDPSPASQNRLFLLSAFRFSMLGLHALYGDRMHASTALARLRVCRFCDADMLWAAVSSIAPRVTRYGFSLHSALESDGRNKADEGSPASPSGSDPISQLTALAEDALPPPDVLRQYQDAGSGWYVVANWLDIDILINDAPKPTYEGARAYGTLANGTLVYVLSGEGYKGLHASNGVWGRIWWQGIVAWIPMNLLVRICEGGPHGTPPVRDRR